MERKNKKITTFIFILTCAVFIMGVVGFVYVINGVKTFGVSNEIEKHEMNEGYFITIRGKTMGVSREQYDSIEIGNWYVYEYRYNKLFWPNKYNLKYIYSE